jgi:hypothetical protein
MAAPPAADDAIDLGERRLPIAPVNADHRRKINEPDASGSCSAEPAA